MGGGADLQIYVRPPNLILGQTDPGKMRSVASFCPKMTNLDHLAFLRLNPMGLAAKSCKMQHLDFRRSLGLKTRVLSQF